MTQDLAVDAAFGFDAANERGVGGGEVEMGAHGGLGDSDDCSGRRKGPRSDISMYQ
jgi:hypothetical protein